MPSRPISGKRYRLFHLLFILGLLAGVGIGYHHTLNSPFLLDDGPNILQNPYIQIDSLSFESISKVFSPYQPSSGRPVANLSFAVNYLLGGYNPVGFHLVNIIIHIATSFILFRLLTLYFLKADFSEKDSLRLAVFATLLWSFNPVQTSAVTYIVQRMTILCTFFFSASLLSYVHARTLHGRGENKRDGFKAAMFLLLSAVLWAAAMLTKEIAAIMPVIIVLHEVYFFKREAHNRTEKKIYVYVVLTFALVFWYLLFGRENVWQNIVAGYEFRDFTPGERLLTETRVVVFYMSLFVLPLPARMTVYHDFPVSSSLTDPVTTLLSSVLLLVLLVFSIIWFRRYPLLSFGMLWTLTCLLIESTFIPLELIFEHRFYLPSIGFSLFLAALANHLFFSVFRSKLVFNFLGVLLLTALVAMTYIRNQTWSSELAINIDGVKKAPNLVRSVNNLAGVYIRAGEFDKGKKMLDRALQSDPQNILVLSNLFMLSTDLNMAAEADRYFKELQDSIHEGNFRCNQSQGLILASEVLVRNGRFPEAIFLFETVQSCPRKDAVFYDNLALCYARTGNHVRAAENFSKALERDPGNPYYIFSLSRSYMLSDDRYNAKMTLKKLHDVPLPEKLKPHVNKLENILKGENE